MGDVDSSNFSPELVAEFGGQVASCSFVAIDLEMSGISFPEKTEAGAADSIPLRYHNVRPVAGTFGVIQVGIALFYESAEEARVWNFYVFPRPVTEGSVSSIPLVTLCSASTNFNRQHGMDFNRWISKGVTFVNGEVERKLEEILLLPDEGDVVEAGWKKFFAGFSNVAEASDEYRVQESRILEEIGAFVADPSRATMKVPFVHGGQRFLKAILAKARVAHPQLRLIEEVSGGGSSRCLTKKSSREIFDDYVGFRHIWKLLTAAGKPVVLHNGMLDLVFCYNAFEADLPDTLPEFKKSLQQLFPGGIFDTRLIAIESGIASAGAALETLAEMLKEEFKSKIVNSGKYSSDAMEDVGQVHEAGYDALVTGNVFRALKSRLEDIDVWKNFVCVTRCLWALSLDNLDSDRLLMDCGFGKTRIVRILSDMSVKCGTRDVLNAFEDLKPLVPGLVVNIQWINDTSGVLLITYTHPADKANDSVTIQVSSKLLEIVRDSCANAGPLGEKVKLATSLEYIKKQMDDLNDERAAALMSKRFKM